MKHQHFNNKKIFSSGLLTAILLLSNFAAINSAYADGPSKPNFSCADINDRAKLAKQGYFITFIEEQFTNAQGGGVNSETAPDTQILDCVRGAKYDDTVSNYSSKQWNDCVVANSNLGDNEQAQQSAEAKCAIYKPIKSEYTDLSAGCDPSSVGGACNRVQAIIAKSGTNLLYTYIGLVYKWAATTVGIVCVLFIIVGGFQITTAGDSGRAEEAKNRILQSLLGLVLLLASGILLYTVNPNFFTLQ